MVWTCYKRNKSETVRVVVEMNVDYVLVVRRMIEESVNT